MRLDGKVAIVTGGASGIGAATAALFAKEGAITVITDVTESDGHQVVDSIKAEGGRASFQKLDVTSEEDWNTVVGQVLEQEGRIDVLVNNAGYSGSTTEDSMDLEAFNILMDVNVRGVFLGMRAVIPAMQEAGGGSIVNISSISGNVGQQRVHVGYNASKGAVRIATKSAAVQNGSAGIRVNSVHPGIMPLMKSVKLSQSPAAQSTVMARIPLGRVGKTTEVGHAVLFLASDDASYITGAELYVDGGYLAG